MNGRQQNRGSIVWYITQLRDRFEIGSFGFFIRIGLSEQQTKNVECRGEPDSSVTVRMVDRREIDRFTGTYGQTSLGHDGASKVAGGVFQLSDSHECFG